MISWFRKRKCFILRYIQLPYPIKGHEESYNPPPEYLFTEEEEIAWKDKEKEERRINFVPKKHECMRKVNPYDK